MSDVKYFFAVLSLLALAIVLLAQILTLAEALKGFSNESVVTIGALYFVVGAVQKSHIMDYLARQSFGIKSSDTVGTARMLITCASLSAWFNNTPLCHLMIPIVRDWARARNIPVSYLLIPLSYTVIGGGMCTMIGTSTSLTVQALIQEDTGFSFPFFAPAVVGVPATILLIAYMVIAGPYLLPARSGLIRDLGKSADNFVAEVQVVDGSVFVGVELGVFVGRLGILQDSIIKIRRKCDGIENTIDPLAINAVSGTEKDVGSNGLSTILSDLLKWSTTGRAISIESKYSSVVSTPAVDATGVELTLNDEETSPLGGEGTPNTKYRDIINPSRFEVIQNGDVIFIASAGKFDTNDDI